MELEAYKAAAEAERSELLVNLDGLRGECAALEEKLGQVSEQMKEAAAARNSLTAQLEESSAAAKKAAVKAAERAAVLKR